MHRGLAVGLWAAVTGVALVMASTAVSFVASGVTEQSPAALAPAMVIAALRTSPSPLGPTKGTKAATFLPPGPLGPSGPGGGSNIATNSLTASTSHRAGPALPPNSPVDVGGAAPAGEAPIPPVTGTSGSRPATSPSPARPPSPAPSNAGSGGPSSSPAPTPSPTSTPSPGPPISPSPTMPPPSPPTFPPPGPSPAPPAASSTDPTRTFAGAGGIITVSCHGSVVSLLSATPADGYAVVVSDAGPDEVEVHFVSSKRDRQIQTRCVNGQPTLVPNSSGGVSQSG